MRDLDSKELKLFHWYLLNADESMDGFKPLKKSQLEFADRLDTVDLMVQFYSTKVKEVAESILEKMNTSKGLSKEQNSLIADNLRRNASGSIHSVSLLSSNRNT